MIKLTNLLLPISYQEDDVKVLAANKMHISYKQIKKWQYLKKSLDARKKKGLHYVLSIAVTLETPELEQKVLKRNTTSKGMTIGLSSYTPISYEIPDFHNMLCERSVIVGFGPAGMFAAYVLAKAGLKPIVLERGAPVEERTKEVEHFFQTGILNPNTNVQFGEGGAGTFSDGKLHTGIHDPRIQFVLKLFVEFGAPSDILYQAKPHIGTDYLVSVVKNIREKIIEYGGEVHFYAKWCAFEASKQQLQSISYMDVRTKQIYMVKTNVCIMAIGHSARDVFAYLKQEQIAMEAKNFAVGVRIEHLQDTINRGLYGTDVDFEKLPAADYKLAVHLLSGHSLYTFCMCPGGFVVASASEENRLVVNGMSYRKRDGVNANSALLVGISPDQFHSSDPLAGLHFQEKLEEQAFSLGEKPYYAPVCRVEDFLLHKTSKSFGIVKPTYQPGTTFASPDAYLPSFVVESLRDGICKMAQKLPGFDHPDALLTGVESRSSSPVRIIRSADTYQSVSLNGLYPCGEGAGYAGGITSAAVDGIKCAEAVLKSMDLNSRR